MSSKDRLLFILDRRLLLWSAMVLLEILFFHAVTVVTSSSTGSSSTSISSNSYGTNIELLSSSPIANWQASWTASQAHGTVMAMMVQNNQQMIIVCRSPSTNVYKPPLFPVEQVEVTNGNGDSTTSTLVLGGLHVQRIQTENFGNNNNNNNNMMMVQYAPSFFPVGTTTTATTSTSTNCYCAMTGLAMDVEHLCRTIQKFADDHYNVYQTSPSTHDVTQRLAKTLSSVAATLEQRLYGVQVLMVGVDNSYSNNKNIYRRNSGGDGDNDCSHNLTDRLCMYSIDPSGTWQSWGKATVIGKYARLIRGILGKKLRTLSLSTSSSTSSSTTTTTSAVSTKVILSEMDLSQALEQLLECWIEVCRRQQHNVKTTFKEAEDWDVFVLQRHPDKVSQCELFQVRQEQVMAIFEKILLLATE
jgi:20S proteasome alpha/beta subunit